MTSMDAHTRARARFWLQLPQQCLLIRLHVCASVYAADNRDVLHFAGSTRHALAVGVGAQCCVA
jgi:hypothetical protein